jgi:hypothetical protein
VGGISVTEQAEQQTEQQIKVRQVTNYQASWTEEGREGAGSFTFQLILDNGAEEYVIRPTDEDADVLTDLFEQTGTIYFDMNRKVLIFGTVPISKSG